MDFQHSSEDYWKIVLNLDTHKEKKGCDHMK